MVDACLYSLSLDSSCESNRQDNSEEFKIQYHLYVVDTHITVLDSVHVQQLSFAKRITYYMHSF